MGFLSNLRLRAQLDWFCVQMNNVNVLKARLRKTLGQNFSPKQSHSVIPWKSLKVMSIVQLEDARATCSVSCPIALWDYSRGIIAITRLRKLRNWEKVSPKQSHSVIPWMSLIMMSIVQLEDARATWSVSCPIALKRIRKVENRFTSDQRGGWEAFEACNLQIARWRLIVFKRKLISVLFEILKDKDDYLDATMITQEIKSRNPKP